MPIRFEYDVAHGHCCKAECGQFGWSHFGGTHTSPVVVRRIGENRLHAYELLVGHLLEAYAFRCCIPNAAWNRSNPIIFGGVKMGWMSCDILNRWVDLECLGGLLYIGIH